MGSYVNSSLRARTAQEDWRSTAGVTISGTRIDSNVRFSANGWGARAPVGLTGGSDADWDEFSAQWDGWLQVNRATKFALRSDDSSRMWIDLNGNGLFGATAPEFINNNWGVGQPATLSESRVVQPGLYRIRIQYEEGLFDNVCELVTVPVEFDLYTDAALTINGLTGSYVNSNLRSYSAQDDWRTSQTLSGSRRDAYPLFLRNHLGTDGWGNRTDVGITGGAGIDWDNYSVQWDGWIRIYVPTRLATLSDDSSRMWVDVNGNGSFAATAPEFINNHWGIGQGDTFGETSLLINPGTYRIRIQYEEGNSANHFALFGDPQETTGPAGYALYFDGVDDRLEIPNAGLSLPTNEITIEFWQRTYELRNQSTFCLVPDQLNNRVNGHIPWSDAGVYWDFGDYAGVGRLSYTPAPSLVGVWNHFALVSSRAGNFQRIYRNGVLEASDSTSQTFTRYAAALRIGGSAAANQFFKGELDEFRIWSVARIQSEIQNNMGCCMADHPDLWGYWRFDEGTGTTVADLSGNGRNGTITGGAPWVVSSIPKAQTIGPEIAVFTGATTNAASARTNNVGNHVFANTTVGSSSAAQTFTIKNVGTANLTGLALIETGAHLNDFSVSSLSGFLSPQGTVTFTVTFTPFDTGFRYAAVNIVSSDENESPFIINLSGLAVAGAPEIAVYNGTTTNAAAARTNNVGTFAFANTSVSASVTQFFTIKNLGTANLTGLGLSESGANLGDFRTGGLSVSSLVPNATTTFWVAFEPTNAGTPTAVIQLANGDSNENPFLINVSGAGTSPAITQQPSPTGACVGGIASFSVGTASPGLTYQWQKRAPSSLAFSNISGATSAGYTTPPVTAADDGSRFRVLVSDGHTTATSSEVVLSVITLTSPTATYDFTSGNLGGGNIYGNASVVSNALVLTSAAQNQSGAFLTPDLAPGERAQGFTAQFKLQIAQGNGYADGFSFNWATNLPGGTFTNAEEGAGSGLRVCFDTFNNGGTDGPAIEVRWGTNLIASYLTNNSFLPGTNDFANVAIRLHSDGTLDVTYRCVPIFSRLSIPSYTPLLGARCGLGARTGGTFEAHTIDDLAIELDLVVPIVEASLPGDLATATSGGFPSNEQPPKAIDNDVTSKYFNFEKVNAGLTITPRGQRPVRALTLISANDVPARDPGSFLLEGSTDGINFTRLASNAVPLFPARYFIQSFAVANSSVFSQYRLRFPTVANPATADAMQIAEVELLYNEELTSTNDIVSITLPPGATDVRGVGALFDRQLEGLRKLELWDLGNSNATVNLTLAAGAQVLKGFELIGAADDFTFPGRRPSSVTVAGSTNGINYTHLATVTPAAPSSNLQIQEFAPSSNNTAFAHYRITFGPPISGTILQVGEMRLFGERAPLLPEIAVYTGNATNIGAARTNGANYTFPDAAIGQTRTATFTIQNLGETNLSALALGLTGPDVNDFNLSPLNTTNLAPNATVTFSVNFEPTAGGTRGASIWITSNDADENPFEIKVSGTGVNAGLAEASIPGDPVTATSANFPAAQGPDKAIDNNVTTKYLNLDKLNTGLTITPVGQQPIRALTVISAEDAPERDPSSFVLEGSLNGTNFTRIASKGVPAFPARNFIQSFAVANTNVFNQYRVLFPTISNAATANSMQIAEVELLYHQEITSTNDTLSLTLPPGATDVRGVVTLFDRQLALLRKFEVSSLGNSNAVVDITPATGTTVLKGFELIGAADDFSFPQRRPSSVTVAGSTDGVNYTNLATVIPAVPTSNLQIQEFATSSNTTAFARYRITFSPPISGNIVQIGEMRLFGEVVPIDLPLPVLSVRASGNNVLVSWANNPGFALESRTNLNSTNWTVVVTAPVLSNGVNTVPLPAAGNASFFRLRK